MVYIVRLKFIINWMELNVQFALSPVSDLLTCIDQSDISNKCTCETAKILESASAANRSTPRLFPWRFDSYWNRLSSFFVISFSVLTTFILIETEDDIFNMFSVNTIIMVICLCAMLHQSDGDVSSDIWDYPIRCKDRTFMLYTVDTFVFYLFMSYSVSRRLLLVFYVVRKIFFRGQKTEKWEFMTTWHGLAHDREYMQYSEYISCVPVPLVTNSWLSLYFFWIGTTYIRSMQIIIIVYLPCKSPTVGQWSLQSVVKMFLLCVFF